jgi:hypothetical protein
MANLHDDIALLLNDGEKVFSAAWGRVGEVTEVHKWGAGDKRYSSVTICPKSRSFAPVARHRHMHGCTTFLNGDDVKLVYRNGVNLVVNTFKEFERPNNASS